MVQLVGHLGRIRARSLLRSASPKDASLSWKFNSISLASSAVRVFFVGRFRWAHTAASSLVCKRSTSASR